MQYTWNSQAAFDMAALPRAAAGHIKLASALQLRVLLWLCCVGQGRFDASSCAVACGASGEACEEALRYWAAQGVVTLEGEPAKAPISVPQPTPAPLEAVIAEPVAVEPLVAPAPAATAYPPRAQVLEVCASDERFAFLLETAGTKLGKTLSPADMSVYLYLYRELALPPEVILMIIGYAVKNGKARLSYIEKTALNWAQDGITTIAAADEHLCRLERRHQAWEQVASWGVEQARPTVKMKEIARRWLDEWHLSKEVFDVVFAYVNEAKGQFKMEYADRIFERLHAEGVTTVDGAKQALEPKPKQKPKKPSGARMKTAKDRAPSFDIGQYEELALRHRPLPPQKSEED